MRKQEICCKGDNKLKKIIDFFIIVIVCGIYLTGCGKGKKVSDKQDFKVDGISEIHVSLESWELKVDESPDEKIHVSYSGTIEKEKSDIAVVQKDITLNIQQSDKQQNMVEQFSAGKPGEITVYLPKGIEIPFKISNGSGNMQIDNISIQELPLVNTSGYVVLSNVTVSNAKIVTTSGDVTFENSTIPDVEIVSKSGYVTLKDVNFDSLAIVTSSGEVGIGGAGVYSALKVQTDSGDVSVSHKESPTDLQLDVTTDSNDITMQLSNIDFTKDTSGCKQGNIGQGNNKLEISSSSGTIIVK